MTPIPFNGERANMTGAQCYKKTATIKAVKMDCVFYVVTLEGTMIGQPGDWLAEGVDGERYPIQADIFEKTYEEADEI